MADMGGSNGLNPARGADPRGRTPSQYTKSSNAIAWSNIRTTFNTRVGTQTPETTMLLPVSKGLSNDFFFWNRQSKLAWILELNADLLIGEWKYKYICFENYQKLLLLQVLEFGNLKHVHHAVTVLQWWWKAWGWVHGKTRVYPHRKPPI